MSDKITRRKITESGWTKKLKRIKDKAEADRRGCGMAFQQIQYYDDNRFRLLELNPMSDNQRHAGE